MTEPHEAARSIMERSTNPQKEPRQQRRYVALIATITALLLTYCAVLHLSSASSMLPELQHFTVHVNRDKAPWERPVFAIREGVPAHISVQSKENGVATLEIYPR
ncbi:hypothetical protein [Burkholderia sp. WSM2230]|uniref:hypothetical protein n=1 Tax=Burkholderia sp. WSM2230 TaxID=944435 RepID=UPI0012EC1E2A|nr:hypothetical protein [Burkholderia sp. WSM2230]